MKQFNGKLFISCIAFITIAVVCRGSIPVTRVMLSSPDGKVKFIVQSFAGALTYQVSYKNTLVIQPSSLGIVVNGANVPDHAQLGAVTRSAVNQTYNYRGVHSLAHNYYNGANIQLQGSNKNLRIEVRAYNDGVAFRYMFNGMGDGLVTRELTAFDLPASSVIWSQPNNKAYEGKYSKKDIADFKAGDLIGPPATIELPGNGGYAAITEGGLTDFAGMSLIADSNHVLKANLSGDTHRSGVIESPWRIIEIGPNLNTLVNCDIIADVSPAFDARLFPKGYATDWVKPGRSVWSWLAVNRSIKLDNMKRFSDDAAALGFEYNLVDEGWANWKDGNRDNWDMMKELVDYSATKGVKIWVWKAYPDRRGIPGIKDAANRKAFFAKCKDLGIVGLKIDFFDAETQEVIDFYQAALKDAAEYHLMLDFHGANKPTGETRTWPNEMSREAVRGLENRPPWAPINSILPFTRYLAGHADYTPVNFGDRLGEISWAQHIATMIVFTSPFLCLGADPQSILDNPYKNFIQSIPTVWDETVVLPQSKIGDLVLYARRKGDTWFIAGINGLDQAREVKVKFDFLKNGHYLLSALKDDEAKQANALVETLDVGPGSTLTLKMNPAGGYVAMIKKQ